MINSLTGSEPMWSSNERYYIDNQGNICEESDPNCQTLLVAKGGSIPLRVAEKYGLVNREQPVAVAETPTEVAIPDGQVLVDAKELKALRADSKKLAKLAAGTKEPTASSEASPEASTDPVGKPIGSVEGEAGSTGS